MQNKNKTMEMNHLLEFDNYAQPQAEVNPSEGPTAQPIFGTVDFSMSGVSDDAMQLIAGLMAQAVLASGEAERVAQQAKTDPTAAANYLQNKIVGIMTEIPGLKPEFVNGMKSQASNLAKAMVQSIPGIAGNLIDTKSASTELKQNPSSSSFLNKITSYFGDAE
jgi:hypothetical protein